MRPSSPFSSSARARDRARELTSPTPRPQLLDLPRPAPLPLHRLDFVHAARFDLLRRQGPRRVVGPPLPLRLAARLSRRPGARARRRRARGRRRRRQERGGRRARERQGRVPPRRQDGARRAQGEGVRPRRVELDGAECESLSLALLFALDVEAVLTVRDRARRSFTRSLGRSRAGSTRSGASRSTFSSRSGCVAPVHCASFSLSLMP